MCFVIVVLLDNIWLRACWTHYLYVSRYKNVTTKFDRNEFEQLFYSWPDYFDRIELERVLYTRPVGRNPWMGEVTANYREVIRKKTRPKQPALRGDLNFIPYAPRASHKSTAQIYFWYISEMKTVYFIALDQDYYISLY